MSETPAFSSMSIQGIQNNWEALARSKPFYAVCTEKEYLKGPAPSFWETGHGVANDIEQNFLKCGLNLAEMTALEVGIGVGRVAGPMLGKCKAVTGVDVSETMLKHCAKHNPGIPTTLFTGSLKPWSADLVYSIIVLQHSHHIVQSQVMGEMFRAARKAVWLQLPGPTGFDSEQADEPCIPMYGMEPFTVEMIGIACRFSMQLCLKNNYAGAGGDASGNYAGDGYDGWQYLFTRN